MRKVAINDAWIGIEFSKKDTPTVRCKVHNEIRGISERVGRRYISPNRIRQVAFKDASCASLFFHIGTTFPISSADRTFCLLASTIIFVSLGVGREEKEQRGNQSRERLVAKEFRA